MANDDKGKDEIRGQIEVILSELQTIRDEIRVRIHLAGMELKDSWKDVESRIEELEQQRPEATQKVRDVAAELRDAFRSLRDKLG
jgi:chromosome segregation ATPase